MTTTMTVGGTFYPTALAGGLSSLLFNDVLQILMITIITLLLCVSIVYLYRILKAKRKMDTLKNIVDANPS